MGKIQEIFNFDDIGKKMKNWAKWSCWVTLLLAWVGAIITFIILLFTKGTFLIAFLVPIIAILYSLLIWIGSWSMYAFGAHIEDTKAIRSNTEIIVRSITHNSAKNIAHDTTNKTTGHPKDNTGDDKKPSPTEKVTTPANVSAKNTVEDNTWVCGKCNTRNLLSNNICWRCNNPR